MNIGKSPPKKPSDRAVFRELMAINFAMLPSGSEADIVMHVRSGIMGRT